MPHIEKYSVEAEETSLKETNGINDKSYASADP